MFCLRNPTIIQQHCQFVIGKESMSCNRVGKCRYFFLLDFGNLRFFTSRTTTVVFRIIFTMIHNVCCKTGFFQKVVLENFLPALFLRLQVETLFPLLTKESLEVINSFRSCSFFYYLFCRLSDILSDIHTLLLLCRLWQWTRK